MALTPSEAADLRDMLDRAKIRGVIERYFHAIDTDDMAALGTCLTRDARLEMNADTPEQSVFADPAAIAAHFAAEEIQQREMLRRGGGVELVARRTHQLSHTAITVTGDVATADSFAIVHIVAGEGLTVRGLRYADEFRRTAAGWRIRSRVHRVLWQYVATA